MLWLALIGCPPAPQRDVLPGLCDTASLAVRADGFILSGADCGRLDLEATVVGDGDLTLSLDLVAGTVVPTIHSEAGGTFRALVFRGDVDLPGDGPVRVWRQGYQSWAWSGVVEASMPELDIDGLPLADGDGDAMSLAQETPYTSWWAGLVGRPGGMSALLGVLGSTHTKFYTAFSEDRAWAVYGGRGEAIEIPAGGTLALDPLIAVTGADPGLLYATWADAVAARNPPRPLPDVPPTGWATWSTYYSGVSEQDVRDNLPLAMDLGLDVFQLDDGWQVRWGDWTADTDFPSGMGPLAADITAAGLRPGLWMAPFYVSRDSATYAAHDDWWVRDLDGDEIRFTNVGSGDYAILDVTQPDAAAFLRDAIAGRVAEGYTYLKLDFLYAGAQEGLRAEPITGMEAYHRGLEILRDAAGEDTYILACGAPLLPSVGFAEGFRTGADIAFELSPDADPAFVRWQARQTAARSFTNGRWWWSDADQILVRGLTDPTGAVAANAASGGTWQLGDALAEVDAEVLFAPGAVATRGSSARPVDPLSYPSGFDASPLAEKISPNDQVPPVWLLDHHVVLLNLGDAPITVDAPPGQELFSGGYSAGPQTRTLAPGAGEIWALAGGSP